jgi:hypothetical protein
MLRDGSRCPVNPKRTAGGTLVATLLRERPATKPRDCQRGSGEQGKCLRQFLRLDPDQDGSEGAFLQRLVPPLLASQRHRQPSVWNSPELGAAFLLCGRGIRDVIASPMLFTNCALGARLA